MDEFKRIGFGKKIYYFKGDINFPSATYLGDGMFVVGGNLTLAARSVFQGRTVFFVKGSTTLNSVWFSLYPRASEPSICP